MTAVVRIRADENSINPTTLASRKDLEALLLSGDDNTVLQGWRCNMVGKELQALLQGQFSLRLDAGRVSIEEV
jgi:ribonuclease D